MHELSKAHDSFTNVVLAESEGSATISTQDRLQVLKKLRKTWDIATGAIVTKITAEASALDSLANAAGEGYDTLLSAFEAVAVRDLITVKDTINSIEVRGNFGDKKAWLESMRAKQDAIAQAKAALLQWESSAYGDISTISQFRTRIEEAEEARMAEVG